MRQIPVFILFLLLSKIAFPQETVTRDTVPFDFWESTTWAFDSKVDQIRNPADNALIAVRYYYANSQVAGEYLRIADTAWLYQEYDSLEPTRLLNRGLYVSDPEYQVLDTLVTFEPETYEEHVALRYARASFKTGPWLEWDRNGYIWTGTYEDGQREGLWQKRDAYDFTELRGVVYDGGEVVGDSVLNWALANDTGKIIGLLCEGVVPGHRGGIVHENTPGGLWRLCSVNPDLFGKSQIWTFTHLDYLPGQCTNESWGSYLFLEDRSLRFAVQAEHGLVLDEGRWELLDGNKILLSLQKRGDHRFQMKYLADGELILMELPY